MKLDLRNAFIALLIAVGASYLWSIHGEFHFDDSHSVESNVSIRSLSNIPQIWSDATTSSMIPENRNYRPLLFTVFTIAWVVGGGATWPFHVLKLLMVALTALGVFAVWRRLFAAPGWLPEPISLRLPYRTERWTLDATGAAFALALVFAIHPAGSECAIYISSTSSLQAAVFYVWAFWAYLRYRDGAGARALAGSLFLFFCSVASKEEGITLPAVILLAELFLNSGGFWARVRTAIPRVLPYGVMALALAGWLYAMRAVSGAESRGPIPPWEYFMTQWRAYLWYMRTWFWPFDLNADNTEFGFSKSLKDGPVVQALIGNLLVMGGAWLLRKRYPAFAFGLIWFYLTISPTSSIVPLAEPVNERRMYLAYVGFAGGTLPLVFAAFRWLLPEKSFEDAVGWIAVVLVVGLYAGTMERNRVWLNSENLWKDTVAKNPTNGRALNNLALVSMARGDYAEALRLLDSCERFWPNYGYCPLNKGTSYQKLGRHAEAEAAYRRALQLMPRNVAANYNMGLFLEEAKNDCKAAIPHFQLVSALTGNRHPQAELHTGLCFARLGQADIASGMLRKASQGEPQNDDILFSWALAEQNQGRNREAIEVYRRIVARSPGHLKSWYNIGVAEMALGNLPAARDAFETVARGLPKDEGTLLNLASVHERMNDAVSAMNIYRRLSEAFPGNENYRKRAQGVAGGGKKK